MLIAVIVLLLLFYVLRGINFYEVYTLLKKTNLFYLALAFLFCGFSFFLWNLRFKISLSGLIKGDYWFLLKVLFAGVFVNNITPGTGIGGEPVRAYFLSKKYRKPKTKFLGGILADKMFNLMVFLLFVIYSLLSLILSINISFRLKLILEIILVFIFLLTLIIGFLIWRGFKVDADWIFKKLYVFKFIKKRFRNFLEFKKYLKKRINNFLNVFKKVLKDRKRFFFGILISFGVWFFIYLTSYFLFFAFNERISFFSVIIVVTLGYLIGDLSPLPGGVGLMEGSMFLLYSTIGVGVELAAVVVLLSRMIYYFYSLVIGGISLTYLKFSLK